MKQVLFAFLLLSAFAAAAQPTLSKGTIMPAAPAAAGMPAVRLARIDTLMQEYLNKRWMGGGVAIVVRGGKIVYYKSFGNDTANGVKKPVSKEDIFRIASQTKCKFQQN